MKHQGILRTNWLFYILKELLVIFLKIPSFAEAQPEVFRDEVIKISGLSLPSPVMCGKEWVKTTEEKFWCWVDNH